MENEVVATPPVVESKPIPTLGTVAELFKETYSFYKENWKAFFYIALIPAVLGSLVGMFVVSDSASVGSAILNFFVAIFQLFAVLALYIATYEKIEPTTAGAKEAYRRGARKIAPFIWLSILSCFLIVGSGVLFIIPAIIVGVWAIFSVYVLFAEDKRGFEAIVASRNYVRNYWWAVLGRIFVLVLATMVVNGIIIGIAKGIFGNLGVAIVQPLVTFLLLVPFTLVYVYRLYGRLKNVKANETPVDMTGTRKWFIGLSIWGVVASIIIFVLMIVFASLAVSGAFKSLPNISPTETESLKAVVQEQIELSTSTVSTTTEL